MFKVGKPLISFFIIFAHAASIHKPSVHGDRLMEQPVTTFTHKVTAV